MTRFPYSTDVTDEEWRILSPLLLETIYGRPLLPSLREMLNAIYYQGRAGGAWRVLPHDLPPHPAVVSRFRRWLTTAPGNGFTTNCGGRFGWPLARNPSRRRAFSTANRCERAVKGGLSRLRRGQTSTRTQAPYFSRHAGLALSDSCSTRATPGTSGSRAGLRHGRSAGTHSPAGVGRWWLLRTPGGRLCGGHRCRVEIAVKPADPKGFVVLPRRWAVERTFGWLGKYRRLAGRDFETTPASSEA